ncbi:MAG TPA: OsmC family protein [Candidatus Kapabacteria bacterium]|nr:OsmC family protein [Candidatus Kapabacteria bacterium]
MGIRVFFAGNKKVYADLGSFVVETDQPQRVGGDGSAPSPYELFLASLATCAGIYVKGFCDSRDIKADDIELYQDLKWDTIKQSPSEINIEIRVPDSFPPNYYDALVNTVNKCAVKKTIQEQPNFNVKTVVK